MGTTIRSSLVLLSTALIASCVLVFRDELETESPSSWNMEDFLRDVNGASLSTVHRRLPRYPYWEITQGRNTYIVFHVFSDVAYSAGLILAAPGGGGAAIPLKQWGDNVTTCYRLKFDGNLKLESYEKQLLEEAGWVSLGDIKTLPDCRQAFWSSNFLEAQRVGLQEMASEGDRGAASRLVRGFWDAGSTERFVLSNRDVELATFMMREYGKSDVLEQLASDDKNIKQIFELSKLPKHAMKNSDNEDEISDLEELAQSGNSDLLFIAYEHHVGENPLYWLCLAADSQHIEARYRLGKLYLHGTPSLQKNLILAYKYFGLAEEGGSHYASINLEQLRNTLLTPEKHAGEKAIRDWKPGLCAIEIESNEVSNRSGD